MLLLGSVECGEPVHSPLGRVGATVTGPKALSRPVVYRRPAVPSVRIGLPFVFCITTDLGSVQWTGYVEHQIWPEWGSVRSNGATSIREAGRISISFWCIAILLMSCCTSLPSYVPSKAKAPATSRGEETNMRSSRLFSRFRSVFNGKNKTQFAKRLLVLCNRSCAAPSWLPGSHERRLVRRRASQGKNS